MYIEFNIISNLSESLKPSEDLVGLCITIICLHKKNLSRN